MEHTKVRTDDFETRSQHLHELTDAELKDRFWQLINEAVHPLLDLAEKNTSPSIERSVLLRMGFSSLEAKDLVEKAIDHRLMGKGVGHLVYRLAQMEGTDIRTAGMKLLHDEGWNRLLSDFGVK
jgi:D-ornithine 4,5-aminomutase subunit alpha